MTDPTKQSQTAQIYRYFCAGGTLTNAEARAMFGCDRLASRVNDIRNDIPDDEKIITVIIKIGNNKRIARYHREVQGFRYCCAIHIREHWATIGGPMNVVHAELNCPTCGKYIGITATPEKKANDFLARFNLKPVNL